MTDHSSGNPKCARTYTITQLRREFGLTTRTLRFYEKCKLLTPERRGVTRIFSHRDRARLQLILRGKRFGFTLTEIKEMLDLYDMDDGQLRQLQTVLPKLRAQLDLLTKERDALGETIADLEASCGQVKQLLREHLGARKAAG